MKTPRIPSPAQMLASKRNWLLRNIVGFAQVLRTWKVPMADPADEADLTTAIEALERINARRLARRDAKWIVCEECAGGWLGGLHGDCPKCKGEGRVRAPRAAA